VHIKAAPNICIDTPCQVNALRAEAQTRLQLKKQTYLALVLQCLHRRHSAMAACARLRSSFEAVKAGGAEVVAAEESTATCDAEASVESEISQAIVANHDACEMCNKGGDLLCCDTCPLVYHMDCLGVQEFDLPEGKWSCFKCGPGFKDCPVLDEASIVKMKVAELKTELETRGLSTSGLKADLTQRLLAVYKTTDGAAAACQQEETVVVFAVHVESADTQHATELKDGVIDIRSCVHSSCFRELSFPLDGVLSSISNLRFLFYHSRIQKMKVLELRQELSTLGVCSQPTSNPNPNPNANTLILTH
jgi:hypothetical protein